MRDTLKLAAAKAEFMRVSNYGSLSAGAGVGINRLAQGFIVGG